MDTKHLEALNKAIELKRSNPEKVFFITDAINAAAAGAGAAAGAALVAAAVAAAGKAVDPTSIREIPAGGLSLDELIRLRDAALKK
jgi:hypothetical protein